MSERNKRKFLFRQTLSPFLDFANKTTPGMSPFLQAASNSLSIMAQPVDKWMENQTMRCYGVVKIGAWVTVLLKVPTSYHTGATCCTSMMQARESDYSLFLPTSSHITRVLSFQSSIQLRMCNALGRRPKKLISMSQRNETFSKIVLENCFRTTEQ